MIDLLCPLPTRASHTDFLSGGVFRGRHTQAGVRVDEDLAMTYSACWCATRIIMESIGNLPLHLDLRDPQHTAYEDTDHPHALLVSSQPNPAMGSHVFRQGRTNHQVNWGNGFAEIERVPPYTPESRALALWPIHPSRVYPASEEKQAQGYAYRVSNNDGSDTDLMPHELLHIPGAHSEDGIWGKGVIAYAREDVGAGLGMNRHGATAVGSGNMPKVVAFVPHMRDREARQSYREEWQEVHGHPDAASIGLLPDTAKLQVLNFSNEDAQYIQNRQFNVIEVARWYNLPPHTLKHLDNAIKCLPGDELVLTEDGPRPIQDVSVGDRVWSYVNQSLVLARVKAVVASGTKPVLTVKTTNRTVRLTDNHRILVRRKKSAARPGPGGHQCVCWEDHWIEAGQLRVGDTLVTCHRTHEEGVTALPTGRECSIGFAEFCGLLLADGNVSRAGSRYVGVQIARAPDASYMPYYRSVMQSEFHREMDTSMQGEGHRQAKITAQVAAEIRDRANVPVAVVASEYGLSVSAIRNIQSGKSWAFNEPWRKPITLHEQEMSTGFSSVAAARELVALGLSGTAHTKRVPGWVFRLPESHRLAFLRGYLDGDGTVNDKGRITYVSVNRLLLEDVRHLCLTCGIPVTNVQAAPQGTVVPGGQRLSPPGILYRFTCSDPGANCSIWSHDWRYQNRLLNGKPFNKKDRNYPHHGGKGWNSSQCKLARITALEQGNEPVPVFDLQVEGTASFIASGVVVHNSNIEEQAIEVVITGLIPWAVLWEEQLGLKLLTPQERVKYHFRHRFEGLLRGDFKRRMEAYEVGLRCGVLTLNLIYRLEGWPEIGPMGDEHYVPVGWTTADRIHKGLPPPSTQTEALGAEKGKNKDVKKKQEQRIARSVLHKLASTVWNGSGTSYLLPQHDAGGSEKSGTGQPRPTEATGGVASPVGAERVAALAASKDAARAVLQHTLSRLFTKEANAARRAVENKDDFDAWLEAFYLKHQALAAEELAPACLALKAAGIAQDAAALAQACCAESRALLTASYNADTPTAFKAKLAAWPTERAARTVTALLGDDHA